MREKTMELLLTLTLIEVIVHHYEDIILLPAISQEVNKRWI